jgi:hypothetical protein
LIDLVGRHIIYNLTRVAVEDYYFVAAGVSFTLLPNVSATSLAQAAQGTGRTERRTR